MKILLINNFFYRKGGSEAVFFNTADLLRKEGHEVCFFSYLDAENFPCGQDKYFVERGGRMKQMRSYFYNREAAAKLESLLEQEKPDIAHVHLFWGGLSPSIFAVLQKHNVPLVHTAHDYRMVCPAYTFRNGRGEICEKCKGGRFIECFKNRCSKGSAVQSAIMAAEMCRRNRRWHPAREIDGIIYVSGFSKRKHEEMDPLFRQVKNTVLYNFTNIGEEYPDISAEGGDYYLYYGRLSDEKGIDTLLSVFNECPEQEIKVVGTGPIEHQLKMKYRSGNIQFLGYRSGKELAELVRNARFVCVPSEWYENNPMTIVEAYSLGVPVIGADIGGIPEILIDDETGYLFDSADYKSLSKAIERSISISEDKYLAMKRNARRFAEEHFGSKAYIVKLLGFYQTIIKEYRPKLVIK